MALPGTVQNATTGLLGFDTDGIVTASTAAVFFAQGFRFCVRYVSRVAQQGVNDLSAPEVLDILNAGLSLMPVQHVRADGWIPTPELGASDGVHAAHHALVIGFPPGINVWCDLEGVAQSTPAQQVIDYCNSWFDAVNAIGYVPGLYVGANAILDAQSLRFSLRFAHYWKSLSRVPDVAGRGYQMIQSREQILNGLSIDENRTQTDLLGGSVLFLGSSTGAVAVPATAS